MWRILSLTQDDDVKAELNGLAAFEPPTFIVDHVANTIEVIGSSAVERYNVYIFDCALDWPRSLSLCNLVRSWDLDCLIIVMSLEQSDREDALQAGADLFLHRPSETRRLRSIIEGFVSEGMDIEMTSV